MKNELSCLDKVNHKKSNPVNQYRTQKYISTQAHKNTHTNWFLLHSRRANSAPSLLSRCCRLAIAEGILDCKSCAPRWCGRRWTLAVPVVHKRCTAWGLYWWKIGARTKLASRRSFLLGHGDICPSICPRLESRRRRKCTLRLLHCLDLAVQGKAHGPSETNHLVSDVVGAHRDSWLESFLRSSTKNRFSPCRLLAPLSQGQPQKTHPKIAHKSWLA